MARPAMADSRRIVWLLGAGTAVATIASGVIFYTHDLALAKAMFWIFIPAIYFYIGPVLRTAQQSRAVPYARDVLRDHAVPCQRRQPRDRPPAHRNLERLVRAESRDATPPHCAWRCCASCRRDCGRRCTTSSRRAIWKRIRCGRAPSRTDSPDTAPAGPSASLCTCRSASPRRLRTRPPVPHRTQERAQALRRILLVSCCIAAKRGRQHDRIVRRHAP